MFQTSYNKYKYLLPEFSFIGDEVKMFTFFVQMTTKSILLSVLLSLLLFLPPISGYALENNLENDRNLSLFGISIHQEKRNDIYVGALFAPEYITDSRELREISTDKRMSLKFISKYSNRKMARLWKQRIAMNNSKSNWQPLTKEIVQFASIFKQPMQAGDEINIDFSPDTGTTVYLNKTLFLTIEKLNFYELLLNIWIGNIPPSEAFKIGITGKSNNNLNEQLIAQYQSLQPVIGRFDEDNVFEDDAVTQVAMASTKQPVVQEKPSSKSIAPAKSKNQKITKPKTGTASETLKTVNDLSIPLSKVDIAVPPPAINLPLTTNTVDKKVPEKKKSVQPAVIKQKPKTKPKTVSKQPIPKQKVAKLDLPKEDFFDVDLFSGAYTLELINRIRKHQSYPKKALAAGHEGNVVVQIKIDKNGDLLDNSIVKRSGSRILDRAVLRMVRKAEPFPKIPKELGLEEFEFEVPLDFNLSN